MTEVNALDDLRQKQEKFREMCAGKEIEDLARLCDFLAMSIRHDQQLLSIAASILNEKSMPDDRLQADG